MSNKPASPSEAHLMELIKTRKYKQYKGYVQAIQNQDPKAEQAVSNNLLHILVQKKYKDPLMMFNALVLYKHVMVGAIMDFICFQDLFPNSIHKEVAKICEYKGSEKDIKSRGSLYFVDLFKIESNETVAGYGYNYIMLALQILKSMAAWYPCDYQNSKQKSVFKVYYDKLLQKNVYFPEPKEFLLIKPADQDLFKKNYQRFLDNLGGPAQEPEPIKKQSKPPVASNPAPINPSPPAVSNPNNKPALSNEKKPNKEQLKQPSKNTEVKAPIQSEMKKEIVPTKPPLKVQSSVPVPSKVQSSVPSKIQSVSSKIQSSVPPKKVQQSGIKNPSASELKKQPTEKGKSDSHGVVSQSQVSQEKKNPSMIVIENSLLQTQRIEKQKPAQLRSKMLEVESKIPGNSLNIQAKSSLITDLRQRPEDMPTFKMGKSVNPPESKEQVQQKLPQPQPIIRNTQKPLNSGVAKPPIQELISRISTKTVEKKAQPIPQVPFQPIQVLPQEKPKKIQLQAQTSNQVNKIDSNTLNQPPFSFNNKQHVKRQASRKIPKMQKPKNYQSVQKSPKYNQQPQPSFDFSPKIVQTNRRKSMPKTQKKFGGTFYLHGFGEMKGVIGGLSPPKTKQQVFNKTLSYFTTSRKKMHRNNELQKYNSLLQVVEKMKLDKFKMPFVSKYFQPVTLGMTMLREQALNLYGSGANYSTFYIGKGIEARLIKEINNQFVLTLHNLTSSTLLIEHFNMHQLNHSKRIKIITWGNNKQPSPYRLQPSRYFDIKFHVEIADLNFKFLNFCIRIDGSLRQLVLPITLLDMCDIQSTVAVSHLQKYALKGSIITSEPFRLTFNGLPSFLGGFKFAPAETTRQRREDSVLIGQCSLIFQKSSRYQSSESDLHVLIKLLNSETRTIQIQVLYVTKDSQAQDLAKVILYLFIFLLQSE